MTIHMQTMPTTLKLKDGKEPNCTGLHGTEILLQATSQTSRNYSQGIVQAKGQQVL
jgi:hypothetical protein